MRKTDETPRATAWTDTELTDSSGDPLHVRTYTDGDVRLVADIPVLLDRAGVLQLYHLLGDHLMATASVPEPDESQPEPLAEWERELMDAAQPTVLEEAQQAVYGDRGQDYGHPRIHWTRTACIWTGLLQHKLAEGEHITPKDVGRLYIGDKLARDVNVPKRDNRVDIAGYALCLDRLETGR